MLSQMCLFLGHEILSKPVYDDPGQSAYTFSLVATRTRQQSSNAAVVCVTKFITCRHVQLWGNETWMMDLEPKDFRDDEGFNF